MKKLFLMPLFVILIILFISSCMKDDTPTCTNNSITLDRHIVDSTISINGWNTLTWNSTKNIYEGILIPGTGNMPKDDSLVTFEIVRRYINGNRIERIDSSRYPSANQPQVITLKDLNTSTNKGIYDILLQLREESGLYREILPSSLAYGCSGYGSLVPSNSQFITDIRLIEVKKP